MIKRIGTWLLTWLLIFPLMTVLFSACGKWFVEPFLKPLLGEQLSATVIAIGAIFAGALGALGATAKNETAGET